MGITMNMEVSEALIVLGALQDKQLAASRLAAIAEGEEREIADLASKILGRVATQIVDALYPDTHCDRGHQLCTDSCGNCPTCFMHEKNCTFWDTFDPLPDMRREDLIAEIEFGLT